MKPKLAETAGLEGQRTSCDESSWRSLVPTLASAGGLLMATVLSLCCLGSAGLLALGVSVGTAGFFSALQPYELLLTTLALFLVMGSFLVSRRASICLDECTVRSVRWTRLQWIFSTLAILVLVASYGYELFQ